MNSELQLRQQQQHNKNHVTTIFAWVKISRFKQSLGPSVEQTPETLLICAKVPKHAAHACMCRITRPRKNEVL